jgi:hypothetical protein
MSKKAKGRRPKPEREAEAVRDCARLMLTWAARLGPKSATGRALERNANRALLVLHGQGR